jgi:flagellar basal-body rod protein FlgB
LHVWSDKTLGLLSKGLDAASLRQEVHAHNLANLNTPGYRRKYVTFTEELGRAKRVAALSLTHQRHLQAKGAEPLRVEEEKGTLRRPDGNSVDLDREMLALVNNQLRYNSMIQLLNSRLSGWRYVINEGRR